jgi:hypothetical protein
VEKRLRELPEDYEALVLLGQVAWDMDNKEDSLACFLKAAKVTSVKVHLVGSNSLGPGQQGGQSCLLPQASVGLACCAVDPKVLLSDSYPKTNNLIRNFSK